MLRVYQSTNAAQAKDYFSNELTQGDYYTEGQEIAGSWGGKAAHNFGLSGKVDQEAFNCLVDNIYPPDSPQANEQITPHNKSNRRPGYDLTFNAPKALSVLYEYSQDERLLDAFRNAVRDTMQSIEEGMHTRVRKDRKDEDRQTGNLAYAEFVHFTARPVEAMAPDPHLHAHCYVMNLTYDSVDEKYKAGQFGEIKTDAPYYEALFHSHLTKSLSDMGLDIQREGKFWTLDGLEKSTLNKFSNRTEQIEEAAKERGIKSDKGKDALAQNTRSGKVGGLTREDLRDGWWDRLDKDEKAVLDRLSRFESDGDSSKQKITAEETLEYAIKHQLERQSVTSLPRLKETALRQGFGEISVEELDNVLAKNDDLLIVGKQATTKQVLDQESQLITFTRNGYAMHDKLNPDYEIAPVTDFKTGKQFELGDEQSVLVDNLLNSRDRIMAIQGKAGTGKTTTLASLIDGIEQHGGSAICLAPTADAAYNTLKKDGEAYQSDPMQNAHTLARYFLDEKLWEKSQGSTLFVDEAGLMSVDDMHTLFALADQFDNRVVLIGDTSQHNSVMRGDAFRILQEQAGLEPHNLDSIRRQQGEYRQAVKTISEGNLIKGYDMLDSLGTITEEGDDNARYRNLADRYADVVSKGKSALTVAPTHAEGSLVTEEIRNSLKDQGMIKNKEHVVTRFRNMQLTEAERGDSFNYQEGQMIRFQQNGKGETGRIDRGAQFTVSKIDKKNVWISDHEGEKLKLDLSQAVKFNIYESQKLNLASGDSIRITEGHKSKDGKRLNNGAIYQVKNISKDGDITLNNGYVLDKDKGNIDYGYVTTSYSSQGKTVDHVFIAQGTDYSGASSAEQFYVSVSRGKKGVEIFTDDKETLRNQIQRSHQRMSATELVGKQQSEKEDLSGTQNLVASLEFYARQFMDHIRDSAEDWLSAFRRNQQPEHPHSDKWRNHVLHEAANSQEKDLTL